MTENFETSNVRKKTKNEKKSKQVTVRLGPTLLARIQKEADSKHISVAGFIQSLLIDYFDHKDLGDKCKQRRTDKQKKNTRDEMNLGHINTDRLIQKILLSSLNVDNLDELIKDNNNCI